jgi:hypothetical protein
MEKILSFSFPPLNVEDKVQLRRIIRAQRAQTLSDILGKAKSPEISERLGERVPEVHRFLGEMVHLSKRNPDLFWQLLDRWPAPFFLSRLMLDPDGPEDPEQLDQLVSNLNAILLFERLCGASQPDTLATYVTRTDEHGRVHGLLHGTSLEFRDEAFRNKVVQWDCTPGEVTIRLAGGGGPEFTVPLPAASNPHFQFVTVKSGETVSFPIIKETTVFGKPVTRFIGAYPVEDNAQAAWNPLPLDDSLTQAQGVISELWPEAIDWAEALVPAFVDMGVPPGPIRFSSSYEPGSPIFMSRIDNPLIHAEDVVHEIQHHRLFLFAGEPHFKSWRDLGQHYVSPYRPDPRPLRGLIIGMHAFLSVNELKRRRMVERGETSEQLVREMAEIHYKNLFAFRTILEHEEFGELGRDLFRQMARALAEHHEVVRAKATPALVEPFKELVARHVATVEKESSELRNASPKYREWEETARLAADFS